MQWGKNLPSIDPAKKGMRESMTFRKTMPAEIVNNADKVSEHSSESSEENIKEDTAVSEDCPFDQFEEQKVETPLFDDS